MSGEEHRVTKLEAGIDILKLETALAHSTQFAKFTVKTPEGIANLEKRVMERVSSWVFFEKIHVTTDEFVVENSEGRSVIKRVH
ncbi:MAG: hypothetical protein QXQ39_07955 [Conexivisphaerales archaeon]